jgi:hypothetical protein
MKITEEMIDFVKNTSIDVSLHHHDILSVNYAILRLFIINKNINDEYLKFFDEVNDFAKNIGKKEKNENA